MTEIKLPGWAEAGHEAVSESKTEAGGCLHALSLMTECLMDNAQFESGLEQTLSIIADVVPGEFFLLKRMELDSLREEFSSCYNCGGRGLDTVVLNRNLQTVVSAYSDDGAPGREREKYFLLTERGEDRRIELDDSIHQVTLAAASVRGGWMDFLLVGCSSRWAVDREMTAFFSSVLRLVRLSRDRLMCKNQEIAGQQRVLRAKQEWQSSVDVLPHLICLISADGRVLRANRALEEIGLGTVKDVTGTGFLELLERLGVVEDIARMENIGTLVRHDDLLVYSASAGVSRRIWQKWWGELDRHPITLGPLTSLTERLFNLRLKKSVAPETSADALQDEAICVAVLEDVTERERTRSLIASYNENLQQQVEVQTRQLRRMNMALLKEVNAHKKGKKALKLSEQLLVAQDTERRRIARELHDGIGQRLSAIRLRVDQFAEGCEIEPGHYRERFTEIGDRAKEALDEVRRVSMDLRPSLLDDLGIIATLSWFLREFKTTAPHLEILSEIKIDETGLNAVLKTQIFRIVQEALNNIVKHADATRVRVTLSRMPDRLELNIRDNGKGLGGSANLEHAGLGLRSMLERAELSGGDLHLTSRFQSGVSIAAVWPIG